METAKKVIHLLDNINVINLLTYDFTSCLGLKQSHLIF